MVPLGGRRGGRKVKLEMKILLLSLLAGVSSTAASWFWTTEPAPYTTDQPDTTEGARPSCRWNCGYGLGSCSCSSSCQYYGTCCHDYHDYCDGSTTASALYTVTGARPSCRWNCGYGLGSCSCSSSCQYYGTCCHDYHDYCDGSTTASALYTVTGARPSCRWNCGYGLGSCSCSSSCQYYGNCCHDYHDYCYPGQTTTALNTITGGAPCGGDLTNPRGEFFSPQFPNNYPNNARCTWRLLASETQVVYLTFTFVQLETCCDSIRVYDGPTDSYPLLGRLPQNQTHHFNSSMRYLTVVFTSDHSVTYQGFRAEWGFTERPYCRGNCGYSFSRCSCTSSCPYYGNCCHDYYTYCQATTEPPTVTQSICGGHLFDSGSISSPYYPNYYHDNAYCVWQLSAPAGQRIFLSFVDLELEHCCNCDYINVYDGSSTASSLLGKLCYNDTTLRDFRSSSSYMTVLFRSDGSVVARGFKAFFSSSLPENTARVACSSDSMTIVIERSYLNSLGISWQNLYVDDHRCRPSANSYEVSFNFPINLCGTNKTTNKGRVVYSNHVRAAPSQSGEITRQVGEFLLSVKCHMEQGTTVGTVYKTKEIINHTIAGIGHFNASMAFYPSSSFSYPILEFPYEVSLNQYLYVQVQLSRADNTLDLLLDSCVASPNHDFQAHSYTLIQNGCVKDNTVYIYTNGRQYYAQFRFRAFKFLRTHSYVFLQCRVVVCADNDYNSRCRQGCRMRNRRSLDSAHHTETVTLGPITLKGAKAESADQVEKEE
ncbi:CUB and zona pellucida-like domain-containing protein 1 isoform X3 [Pygocentrus nattereri]|uniref:CUB and zona pellucida-like domain-containing protein 1 isoform X3 n=1 Tax=Pygocentrus nattereri TaxID=42514 RepID=UPI001891D709|nr:CUB and zona pellucida-like domain-containing protein 1 isoform X3 [Pygocentrus nattereri]